MLEHYTTGASGDQTLFRGERFLSLERYAIMALWYSHGFEDGIPMKGLTRRHILRALSLGCFAAVGSACARRVVEVERVVEKEVTTVITEIVRETVIVEGTPKVVERTIAVPMVVTAQPTQRPTVALVVDALDYGWTAFGRAMAPAFEEMFPAIRVEWRATSNWSTYPRRVATLRAAGQLGDVVEVPFGALLSQWHAQEVLQPLDAIMADEHYDTSGVFRGALSACTREGQVMAIPLLTHAGDCLLTYRRSLLDAVGVEPPSREWVLQDLLEAAGAVTRGLCAEKPPIYGYGDSYRLPAAYPLMRAFGAELFDAEGRSCTIQSAEGVVFLRWLYDAMHTDSVAPRPHEAEGSMAGMFAEGRLAMVRADLMGYVSLQHLGGEDVDGALLPPLVVEGPPGAVAEGVAYGISARSPHPSEAFQWIRFMCSREMGVQMFLRGYAEPGCRAASWRDPRVLERCPLCARVADVAETAAAERLPWNLRHAECLSVWHAETEQLARGATTPEACAAAVASRIDALLEG